MTRLSINVNKIALIRNSRGSNFPHLGDFVKKLLDGGVGGITVHPRPDERHIKYEDVYSIADILKNYKDTELNIEGFPDQRFIKLIQDIQPDQCTLVPDSPNQLTSNHGWPLEDSPILYTAIQEVRTTPTRLALFIEPNKNDALLARKYDIDAVEIYTEHYASRKHQHEVDLAVQAIKDTCFAANAGGLIVNAGHDLNLDNLDNLLKQCPIHEVSIGHAFTVECIHHGLSDVLKQYKYIAICQRYESH